MNTVRTETFASSLTNLCEVNSSFDKGILRICYTNENRNGSYFSKETLDRCKKTIYNCPVVCNYNRETDTLGGHDVEIVNDGKGNYKLINVTMPVGVVPESANVWYENINEPDGSCHEYLCTEVLLWKRQEAYEKIKNEGITAQSMEINVKEGKTIDGYYHITDFEFNAFALIGVEPCFESASLETFSKEQFKMQMSEMMQDLKTTFNKVITSEEDDNIKDSMEGGEDKLEEKIELAKNYGINVDSLDFSLEDFTVDELKEKFEKIKSEDDSDNASNQTDESEDINPEKDESSENKETDNYALANIVIKEMKNAVRGYETFISDWGDKHPRYEYIDCDFDAKEVYCIDCIEEKLYGFTYTMDGDAVTIDFATKKRMTIAVVEFVGDDSKEPAGCFAEIKSDINRHASEYKEMKSQNEESYSKIKAMEAELEELRKFKSDIEELDSENKRKELFSKFEDLDGIEEFETLKENCKQYDMETIEEKCYAIRGKNISSSKFSLKSNSATAPKLKVVPSEDGFNKEPYGGIIEKYTKK